MTCYRLQQSGCIVCFYPGSIKDLQVDLVVHFVDPKFSIRTSLDEEFLEALDQNFFQKWSELRMPNYQKFLITRGGRFPWKSIMCIVSWYNKPNNIGYFDAISEKVKFCLEEAEKNNFSSVAFAFESHDLQNLVIESLCDVLKKLHNSRLKKIYFQSQEKNFCQNLDSGFHGKGLGVLVRDEAPQTPAKSSVQELKKSSNFENGSSYFDGVEQASAPARTVTPMDVDSPPKADDPVDSCTICLCDFTDKKTLDKCGHAFCSDCIDRSFSTIGPSCPICNTVYGEVVGLQPPGTMTVEKERTSLPGHNDCGHYVIKYHIPSGIQQPNHPNPGNRFSGTNRIAFLPANNEGEIVLKMLQKAFLQKLIFTVGFSRTTNQSDTVTWNDIHHKTSMNGGEFNFGYPDPKYLNRVTDELKAKGIVPQSVADTTVQYQVSSE